MNSSQLENLVELIQYDKELMAALTLTGNTLYKEEMEYHEKFGHNIGRIQHIALMSIIDICYATYCLSTQTVVRTIHIFLYIKICIKYLVSHSHKPIFYPYNYYCG